MDILAHGLWGAIAAKTINKALRAKGKATRINPWWMGFWATFPDLLAFTLLFLFIAWNVLAGVSELGTLRPPAPDEYLNPIQYAVTSATGTLYAWGHSAVVWLGVFIGAFLLYTLPFPPALKLRRVPWELFGWLTHVVFDVVTHPSNFYPTPFLWPLSDFRFDGIPWTTPTFLIVDYVLVLTLLYLLRERRSIIEGFRVMTLTKKLFLAGLAVVAIAGGAFAFQRRSSNEPPALAPVAESRNIRIFAPRMNEIVGVPLTIVGEARVFENQFSYRVRDEDGAILGEHYAMTEAPDAGIFGRFEVTVPYRTPKGTNGTIEVFQYSAKDGSEVDMARVPVVFAGNPEVTALRVFFSSRTLDPGAAECNRTYPVTRRVAKTTAVARAALEELLRGPDRVESEEGYFTSMNSGVRINSLTIKNGVARVDFDAMMEAGVGGSCRVAAIRSQIVNTLQQFSTVEGVVISVAGRVEDALQP